MEPNQNKKDTLNQNNLAEPQSAAEPLVRFRLLPFFQEVRLTSPNFVFGLTLIFIALLWIILFIAPFTNLQMMTQMFAAYASGMIVTFVLTFFMTLLAGILNSKYSPRVVDVLFSQWTIGYMFLFIVSIIYALLNIKGNVSEWHLRFGFGLLSTCLFLLIPYIVFVKEYLKPAQYLDKIKRYAMLKIQHMSAETESLPEEINQIDYLVVSSQRVDDYDTFEKGLESLANLIDYLPNEQTKQHLIQRFESIARSFITKPHAPVIVIGYLEKLGLNAIQSSRYAIVQQINEALINIGEDATKIHGTFVVNRIIAIFNRFGKEICYKKDWTTVTKQLFRNLGNLGDQCLKRKLPASCEAIAKSLGELGELVGKSSDFEDLTYEVVNLLKSLSHTAKLADYDEVRKAIVLSLGNIGKVTTTQPGLKELTSYIISAWEQSSEGLEM
ncbi:MAG: hypothetical protein N3A72_07310 [bacterium]|nr:hypothetical protein [bacterium]